jgi:hypothetical protein
MCLFCTFLVPKAMHFTFSQPVIGCMKLFGMHFIAIGVKLLLATSFVYPLIVDALKNCFICYFAFAANLQHFGTKISAMDFFWQSVHG